MKGKIFVFAIGGTGVRVLRSLVMLAASGVDFGADAVVPIIVDPDFANADLTRAVELIKKYSSIREGLDFGSDSKSGFFKLPIRSVVNDYRFALRETKNRRFKDFIGYDTLVNEDKALVSMLFSEANLEADMEVGFKGNPNMGSVVLNQFTESSDFCDFAAAFMPGDRIFIISSIFGGTGASGFPVLLKNIRNIDSRLPNSKAISQAPIGAITVLPYFEVSLEDDSAIDSSTFIGKTKAALHYYENNVTGAKSSVNVLYYIGDTRRKQYDNKEGGQYQRNDAHFVELAAALAISDFAKVTDDDPVMQTQTDNEGRVYADNARFKEFGIDKDEREIGFNELSNSTKAALRKPLAQFALLSRYIVGDDRLRAGLGLPWGRDNHFDDAFVKGVFVEDLKEVCALYLGWLKEMAENDRSFRPFNLSVSGDAFNIVNGVRPSRARTLSALFKSGYDLYDSFLDTHYRHLPKNHSKEQKFVELFYSVTKELVERKYNF